MPIYGNFNAHNQRMLDFRRRRSKSLPSHGFIKLIKVPTAQKEEINRNHLRQLKTKLHKRSQKQRRNELILIFSLVSIGMLALIIIHL